MAQTQGQSERLRGAFASAEELAAQSATSRGKAAAAILLGNVTACLITTLAATGVLAIF